MAITKIEWCERTWSPITGCSPVSEGCQHCYARRMAQRLKGRYGYPADDPFRVTFHPERLTQPFIWFKPSHIFVCSMGDLFHEKVSEAAQIFIMNTILGTPQHTYIVLTKRPSIAAIYFIQHPVPSNLWLGVTAENQQRADERIPILLQIPAAVRFVSIEPMLGPISFRWASWKPLSRETSTNHLDGLRMLDWIIIGGETGPGARPMHPDWVQTVRDQCQEAGVPFFFKQWGEWIPRLFWPHPYSSNGIKSHPPWGTLDIKGNWFSETTPWNGCQGDESKTKEYLMVKIGKKRAGRLLDGRLCEEYPE